MDGLAHNFIIAKVILAITLIQPMAMGAVFAQNK
jgi:hypothetical protein